MIVPEGKVWAPLCGAPLLVSRSQHQEESVHVRQEWSSKFCWSDNLRGQFLPCRHVESSTGQSELFAAAVSGSRHHFFIIVHFSVFLAPPTLFNQVECCRVFPFFSSSSRLFCSGCLFNPSIHSSLSLYSFHRIAAEQSSRLAKYRSLR